MTTFGDHSSGRDNNFNLLRMIAASSVLISHSVPISLGPDVLEPLQRWLDGIKLGTVAVYVFFAISGFFITKSFDRGNGVSRFLKARILRLVPGLSTALIVTVLVIGAAIPHAPSSQYWAAAPRYVLQNLALYQPLYGLPGVFETQPFPGIINGSLWTLFYEVACYMSVMAFGVIGLLRQRWLIAAGTLAFLLAAILRNELGLPGRVVTFIELGFPFALGAFAWVWRDRIPLSPWLGAALALAAVLTHGTMLFPVSFSLALSYWSLALGFFKLGPLAAYNRLGDYSYGMYIYAFPVQQAVAAAGVRDPVINIAYALPLTLFCAVLSWHFVERPSLHLVKHTA
ncbi:MAG: acyltransferase [Rhodobacteraceae bacterium]|nr:acyltransferase [Paracoccaceae bacterium]